MVKCESAGTCPGHHFDVQKNKKVYILSVQTITVYVGAARCVQNGTRYSTVSMFCTWPSLTNAGTMLNQHIYASNVSYRKHISGNQPLQSTFDITKTDTLETFPYNIFQSFLFSF